MAKNKVLYACQHCGSQFPKWSGQCAECGKWNTISEEADIVPTVPNNPSTTRFTEKLPTVTTLANIPLENIPRIPTHASELDRVLGGGLVPGSVILIGGDPGIGKSTLLLQGLAQLSKDLRTLYVTGEESLQQVALRAQRIGLPQQHLRMLADTHVETVLQPPKKKNHKSWL